jgi:hypothetical protein
MALEGDRRDLTNRVTTSFTPVHTEADLIHAVGNSSHASPPRPRLCGVHRDEDACFPQLRPGHAGGAGEPYVTVLPG